jgi:diaminohydroxyphosphoribosylaminopyrimidine deaminase/5-amino-6-(5-phosphoribosylamino)uracil reductase
VNGSTDVTEDRFLDQALALAERGLGLAAPNPMVGAVLVSDGRVVGEGWHEGPGTEHAEAMALRGAGDRARGSTLYVTLEPCSHQGRTPPCAPALVAAGVSRVVAGVRDPNPIVDGRGFALLRAAGVDVVEDARPAEAGVLIEAFAHHVRTGLPLVTLKMAASLDGRVAATDGSSRWITGEAAREDVHRLRARAGAVVVGAGTALADDPALTVRLPGYRGRQPLRVLVDARGVLPTSRAAFDGAAPLLVATTTSGAARAGAAWETAGAEVEAFDGADGRVSIPHLVEALGKRDVQAALLEGGPSLAWSAVRDGVVDRFVLYLAPKLIGGTAAPGILGGDGVASIDGALATRIVSVEAVGDDLKVVSDVHRDR